MKNSKGNAIIVIIVIALIVLMLGAAGLFVYLNTKNTNANTNENNDNIENNQAENEIITNNETIIEPAFNEIIEDEQDEIIKNNEISSASYYYKQLDSNAKKIYSKLKEEKNSLKTGTYIFEFGTEFNNLLHSEKGEEMLKTAFQSAIDAFFYDDCSLFYVDINKINLINEKRTSDGTTTYYISIGPGNNKNYLQDNFQTKESIENAQNYLDNIINQMIAQTQSDTIETKITKVHNWLVRVVNYEKSDNNINQYNIYGAIHDKKAVCEGYARSFKYIMEKMSIPTILVSGTAKNSEGKIEAHAWNYVEINENWYAVDVTWDDPVIANGTSYLTDEKKYKYFLKGADEFFKDHTESGTISENGIIFSFPLISGGNYQ